MERSDRLPVIVDCTCKIVTLLYETFTISWSHCISGTVAVVAVNIILDWRSICQSKAGWIVL